MTFALLYLFFGDLHSAANFHPNTVLPPAFGTSAAFITPNELAQTTIYNPIWPVAPLPVSQPRPLPRRSSAVPTGEDKGHAQHQGIHTYSKQEVVDLIQHHSTVVGISHGLAARIAFCESGYNHLAKNKASTASGVFQYLAGTWSNTSEGKKGTSPFDADANIRMAVTHIAAHGTAAWDSSKGCWNS